MQGQAGGRVSASSKMQVSCPKCSESMIFTVEAGVEMVRLECTKCKTVIDAVTKSAPPPPAKPSTGADGLSKKSLIDLTGPPSESSGGASSKRGRAGGAGQQKQAQQQIQPDSDRSHLANLLAQKQQHNAQPQQQGFGGNQMRPIGTNTSGHNFYLPIQLQLQQLQQQQQQQQQHQQQQQQQQNNLIKKLGHWTVGMNEMGNNAVQQRPVGSGTATDQAQPGGALSNWIPQTSNSGQVPWRPPIRPNTIQQQQQQQQQQQHKPQIGGGNQGAQNIAPEAPPKAPEPKPPAIPQCSREVYCNACMRLLQVNVCQGQRAIKISCPGCSSSFPLEHPLDYRPPDDDGDPCELPPLPNAVYAALYMTRILRKKKTDDLFRMESKRVSKKQEGRGADVVEEGGGGGGKRKERAAEKDADGGSAGKAGAAGGRGKKQKTKDDDEGKDKGRTGDETETESESEVEEGKDKSVKAKEEECEDVVVVVEDSDEVRELPAADLDGEDEECDIDDETVGTILECWAFVMRASDQLDLKPMSLDKFLLALTDKSHAVAEGETRPIDDIFMAMVDGACRTIHNASAAVRAIKALNVVTWPEALRAFLAWRSKGLYKNYIGCNRGEENDRIDYSRERDCEGTEEGAKRREAMDKDMFYEAEALQQLASKLESDGFRSMSLKERLSLLMALTSQMNSSADFHYLTDEIHTQNQFKIHTDLRTLMFQVLNREAMLSDEAEEESAKAEGGKRLWDADENTLGSVLLNHKFIIRPATSLRLASPDQEPIMLPGVSVFITGLADGTQLPLEMQDCKGVIDRTLFHGWYLVKATNSLPWYPTTNYAPPASPPETQVANPPSLTTLLINMKLVSDGKWRKFHQAACLKARLTSYATCSHYRSVNAPRIEVLGYDRSNRQIMRFFGEVDEAWVVSPDTGKWGIYRGPRLHAMVKELAPLKITSEFLTWREISTPTTIVGQLDKVGVEGDTAVNVWNLLEDKVLDEDNVLARKGRMRAEKVLEVEDDEVTCHVTGETYSPRTHWHCASTYVTLAKGGGRGRSKGGPKEEPAGGVKVWKGWMAAIKSALKSADHVKALEKQLLRESGHSKPSDVIKYYDDLVTVPKLVGHLVAAGIPREVAEGICQRERLACASWRHGVVHYADLVDSLRYIAEGKPIELPTEFSTIKRQLMDLEASIPDAAMPFFSELRREQWSHMVKYARNEDELIVCVLYLETCIQKGDMVKDWKRLPRQLKEEPEGGAPMTAPERTWPSLEDEGDNDDAVDSPSEDREVALAPMMLAELRKDLMAVDASLDIVREGWSARAAAGGGATFIDPTGKHYPHAASVKDVMEGAIRSSSPQGEEGGGGGGGGAGRRGAADGASSSVGAGSGGGGGRGKRGRPSSEAAEGPSGDGMQQQDSSGRGGKRVRSGSAFSTGKKAPSKPRVVEEVMWGRPAGCAWWPCVRLNPDRSPEGAPQQPQGKGTYTLVVFLGSFTCSWLTEEQLSEYSNTGDKGLKRKLRADELKKAVKHAGDIASGVMSVDDAVERAEQLVAEARREQEALDEELARKLQRRDGGGGEGDGGERRSKSSRAAAQRSFREPIDMQSNNAESKQVSSELEFVLSKSYEVTDIGRGFVGLATLMYLVDAGFDFEKLQDDDEDWEKKCRGGGRPTTKGVKRLGRLYWVKREGENPVPAELCCYEDKAEAEKHPGKALVCFFDTGETKWVEASSCLAFKTNLEKFRGWIDKTDKGAAVLAKAESRLHDLSSILMVSGVDQDKGTYIVPSTFDRVLRPGSIIEVEVEDAGSKKVEWIPGKVSKMLPANFEREESFQVHIILVNAKERGDWYETYRLSEEGHDWRWPSTSS